MASSAVSNLPRRVVVVLSAFALLLTGVTAVGLTVADAAAVGATASVSPTTTPASAATAATFTVSNTKTAIVRVTIQAPAGLPFSLGTTPTGWTASLATPCGTSKTAACKVTYKATSSSSGVGSGAKPSVSFPLSFTAPAGSATLSFAVKGFSSLTSDDYVLNTTTSITVQVPIVPGSLTLSGQSAPNAPDLTSYVAGVPVTAKVTLKDTNGNQMSITDPTKLSFTPTSGDGTKLTPTFSLPGDGTAALSILYTGTGGVTFTVGYSTGGAPLSTAPTSINYVAGAGLLTLGTLASGTTSGTAFTAGDTLTGTVTLADSFGNPIALDAAQLVANPPTSGAGAFTAEFVSSGPNTATMTFTYTKADTLAFTLSYAGATPNPTTSTRTLTFATGPAAKIEVAPLVDVTNPTVFFSGDSVRLLFQVTDASGNPIDVNGSDVTVTRTKPGATGAFVTTGTSLLNEVDGYYTAAEATTLTVTYSPPTGDAVGSVDQTFLFQTAPDNGIFRPGVAAEIVSSGLSGTKDTCTSADGSVCGWVDLPNGGNGKLTVSLSQDGTTYNNTLSITGANGQDSLKDAKGAPLYTNDAPLPVTYVCTLTGCPLQDMPNDNGVDAAYGGNNASVGAACQNSGTVFSFTNPKTQLLNKYCVYNSAKERVQYAQSYYMFDQLSSQTTFSLIENSCQTDNLGNAIAISSLDSSVTYPAATKIPTYGWDGVTKIHSCIDVSSIHVTVTGQGTSAAQFFVSFRILATDDYTTKLR
jgi:hypothetical protein